MKLTVEFNQDEIATMANFADIVEETCETVNRKCAICPLYPICKGNIVLADEIMDCTKGYNSEVDGNMTDIFQDEEEPNEEETE